MGYQTYTGAWAAGWATRAPFTSVAGVLHTADPAHGTAGEDPRQWTWAAPAGVEVAATSPYVGTEYLITTPGVDYHEQPQLESPDAHQGGWGNHDGTGALAYDHGPQVAPRFADEHRFSAYTEGLHDLPTVNETALRRGMTGEAVNNPDGYRAGVDYTWGIQRKIPVRQTMRHSLPPLFVNTVTPQYDQPAAGPNPYSSPFSTYARAFANHWQRAGTRREPPGLSEAVTTDPVIESAQQGGWVL